MRIGVDIISGEKDPMLLVEGALDALKEEQDITVVLIGPEATYRNLLAILTKKKRYSPSVLKRLDF